MKLAVLKSFGKEIEKTSAGGILGILGASTNLLTVGDKMKESHSISKLNPMQRDADLSMKLKSPYQYQFEGGKKTGLTETTTPHTF